METKTKAHVLIVDDNEMNRDLLARRLQRQGHQTTLAENGLVAIEQLRAHHFDLVLLDIMMPVMNGYQVLEQVKANVEWRDIPVIVISAADDMESIVRCIELGAEDYLPKPYNAMLLKARIGASLEKKVLRDSEKSFMTEMAILQEIDRALNATLDVTRAMDITLGWALRHSKDQAGFMGLYENGRIHVIVAQGYPYELTNSNRTLLVDELPAVPLAINSGKATFVTNTTGTGMLLKTQSQLAMPICRDDQILAFLVMENNAPKEWDTSLLTFLNRLSDHAAMAIANAQMYTAVQSANQAKTEFVSFVSHELKIPMTAIKGYADLLLAGSFGGTNEMQTKFLHTIRANVNRMATLVSDLTDISRIESGHLRLDFAPTPFPEVVDEVIQSTRGQIQQKSQILTLNVPSDLPLVHGDRSRLLQVLTNLVSNAHKYTPENGRITITAEVTLETPASGPTQPMLRIAIADNGLGIKEEDQPTIFEKFTRADDDEARKSPGTGLGLNITRSLVELHNGRIWFHSQFRHGTTFIFTLPLAGNK